ncbi:MAG: hypothetical protein NZ455_11915 [Bacteroidia bacterium]|nr:hypothetical protein [Bacteroidia bacterium]MDW8346811.1 hypothetical protein [Bacteroidia bacterium]
MGVSLAALRVGVLRATLRFGASLRYAPCYRTPSACLTQQRFDVLPCFHTYLCFILF